MTDLQPSRSRIFSIVIVGFGLALFTLTGCKKSAVKTEVLAQVGSTNLTLAELRESFPAEYEQLIRRDQYLDFVKRWINDEVIYQQAKKAHLAQDSAVARKLAKVTRKLLIEEFLARENAPDVFEPDEMSMNQYYEMHKEEFRRKTPETKLIHIRVQTPKQALDLRSKVLHGDFLEIAVSNSLDPAPESYASIGFKKQTDLPSCLSQDISSAGVGTVSLPIACPDGMYLVKILEKQEVGSLIPFAEAKEEISGILSMDRKDKLLDGKIAKFKQGLAITFNIDQIPGLTENSKNPEHEIVTAHDAPSQPLSKSTQKTKSSVSQGQPIAPQTYGADQTPSGPSGKYKVKSNGEVSQEKTQEKSTSLTSRKYSTARKRASTHVPAPAREIVTDSLETKKTSVSTPAAPEVNSEPAAPVNKPEAEENSNAQ